MRIKALVFAFFAALSSNALASGGFQTDARTVDAFLRFFGSNESAFPGGGGMDYYYNHAEMECVTGWAGPDPKPAKCYLRDAWGFSASRAAPVEIWVLFDGETDVLPALIARAKSEFQDVKLADGLFGYRMRVRCEFQTQSGTGSDGPIIAKSCLISDLSNAF